MRVLTRHHPHLTSRLAAPLLAASFAAAAATAGPLNPPPGPVAPTMKTLAEVEARTPVVPGQPMGQDNGLYTFDQPGSYYLTGDIVVTNLNPEHAVFNITASDVTIDFNGFSVRDLRTNAGIVTIRTLGSARRATIANGSVLGGQKGAIDISGGSIIRNMRIAPAIPLPSGSTTRGVELESGSLIEDCTVTGYAYGINIGTGSVASGCVVRGTTNTGIEAYSDSLIRGCVVSSPGNTGLLLSNSVAESCTVAGGSTGINAMSTSLVRDCTVRSATLFGIYCQSTAVATGNIVFGSGTNYNTSQSSGAVVFSLNDQPATANLSR
jgi:hypothetical protein